MSVLKCSYVKTKYNNTILAKIFFEKSFTLFMIASSRCYIDKDTDTDVKHRHKHKNLPSFCSCYTLERTRSTSHSICQQIESTGNVKSTGK